MEKAKENTAPATEIKEEKNGTVVSNLYEMMSVIISSIMIIAVIFTFAFRLVGVSGKSMLNTLHTGDWLVVVPYYSEPKYGDIAICTQDTAADGNLVKRVIGEAGDEVTISGADEVSINGVTLNESSYALKDGLIRGNRNYPVTVPDSCVMLMGDNRIVSWDSRFEEIGFIENDYLLGKAIFRLSLDWNIYADFVSGK